jgi:hypothetical protein
MRASLTEGSAGGFERGSHAAALRRVVRRLFRVQKALEEREHGGLGRADEVATPDECSCACGTRGTRPISRIRPTIPV